MYMTEEPPRVMAKTRALLTETDREYLTGEHGDDKRYQSASRVRRRVREELQEDIAVLEEHHPELLEEVRAVIRERTDGDND